MCHKGSTIGRTAKHLRRKVRSTAAAAPKIAAALALCELFVIFVGKISQTYV